MIAINGIVPRVVKTYGNGAVRYDYGELPSGDDGVKMTIELMSYFANRDAKNSDILKIAKSITSATKSQIERVRKAFSWVIKNVAYVKDGVNEFVTSPRHLVRWHFVGDCDCMSTFLVSLLKAVGIKETYFKTIAHDPNNADKGDPFTHVYVLATIPELNITIPLDPVMNNYGFGHEYKPVRREKIFAV